MIGETRRTGEPGAAHIFRTVSRGLTFIQNNMDEFNKNGYMFHFTPESAELLLLTCALHDFKEDKITLTKDDIKLFIKLALLNSKIKS